MTANVVGKCRRSQREWNVRALMGKEKVVSRIGQAVPKKRDLADLLRRRPCNQAQRKQRENHHLSQQTPHSLSPSIPQFVRPDYSSTIRPCQSAIANRPVSRYRQPLCVYG